MINYDIYNLTLDVEHNDDIFKCIEITKLNKNEYDNIIKKYESNFEMKNILFKNRKLIDYIYNTLYTDIHKIDIEYYIINYGTNHHFQSEESINLNKAIKTIQNSLNACYISYNSLSERFENELLDTVILEAPDITINNIEDSITKNKDDFRLIIKVTENINIDNDLQDQFHKYLSNIKVDPFDLTADLYTYETNINELNSIIKQNFKDKSKIKYVLTQITNLINHYDKNNIADIQFSFYMLFTRLLYMDFTVTFKLNYKQYYAYLYNVITLKKLRKF